MRKGVFFGLAVLVLAVGGRWAAGVSPTADELALAQEWRKGHAGSEASGLPFSFGYGGKSSAECIAGWEKKHSSRELNQNRTEYTDIYRDPQSGLEVRCVTVAYKDFPTLEWTVYFRNGGKADTAILENIQALDVTWQRPENCEFILHSTVGDGYEDIYGPRQQVMQAGAAAQFAPVGGRSCSGQFPYFKLEWQNQGVVLAIGWPGQWAANFTRDNASGLRVLAGQELTHFELEPGEEVRTPLIVLQFWKGDAAAAQNVWRKWMLEHNLPRPLGPQMAVCTGNSHGLFGISEENQRQWLARYLEEDMKPEYWWVDLGWFEVDLTKNVNVFNALYDPDPVRFPSGLKPFSDYLHSLGIKLIAWFEPEHYYPGPGNWIVENHPEWLLKAPPGHETEINQGLPLKNRVVLNLGNPEALKWVTDNVDRVIKEQGIDLYRHDFNIEPLIFWRGNDAEDRQGITENKYVSGFLAYFDELRRRHPGMLIDNCASGGRRNDVETLRRSVPLLRSDAWGEPVSQQCQTYGLMNWIPFWGTGIVYSNPAGVAYHLRSQLGAHYTNCWDLTIRDFEYDLHRKLLGQWREIAPYFLEDYYPLTPYSTNRDVWMAWQYAQPEGGEGAVMAFRRENCIYEGARLKLKGLESQARYTVKNLDTNESQTISGQELLEKGLYIAISEIPGSAVITYKKMN